LTRGPLLARRLSTQVLHLTRFGRPPTRVVTRMQADGAIVTKTKVLLACSPKSSGGFLLRRSPNKPEISPSPSTRRPGPLLIPLQADSSCSGLRASRQHVHAPDSGSRGQGGASRPNARRTGSTERVRGGQVEWRNPGRAITAC
jgi:hypothetical protein